MQNEPAIIFDLDGTLIDTLDDITDAINVVFAQWGMEHASRDRIRSLIGEGLRSLLSRASNLQGDDRLDRFVQDYRVAYRERMLNRTGLFPGIGSLLDTLTAANAAMAVLSNKPHQFTAPICSSLLSRWPFVECMGWKEHEPRKPDPATALALARELDRPPNQVVFVGDSAIDIQTARNAGMTSVGVTWGYRDREELKEARANFIISRPEDLILVLG